MKRAIAALGILLGLHGWSQMTTQGTAFIVPGGCDCYELTSSTNDAGAIWSPEEIDLSVPFDMTFDIYLGSFPGGADGMMFVMQELGTGVGPVGNGLGYAGITNSIGIEIDTWNSGPSAPGDIASDHIGMNENGMNNHALVAASALPEMEDDMYHTMQIIWDPGTTALAVFIDGTLEMTYVGDLITSHFGSDPNVYFGFTAATGGAWNTQRVCMTRDADFSADLTTVCPGVPVTFTDASTSSLNNITAWDWDFGDGGTSTDQNPSYSWTESGTWTTTLTITDASGCTDVMTMDIEVLPDLVVDSAFTNVSCFGHHDGEGVAIPGSGTAPYSYIWDDPGMQTTDTATGLTAGTYTVIVTDDLGCTGTTSVTITEPTDIEITGTMIPDDGVSGGSIDITVTGGTPGSGGYTFLWSPGGETTEDIDGLTPGEYTVTATDSMGCSKQMTFQLGSQVGIGELADDMNIYPNPTTGYFQIETTGYFEVSIMDLRGRFIEQAFANDKAEFDLTSYERGVYMIKIKKSDQEYVHKLVLK